MKKIWIVVLVFLSVTTKAQVIGTVFPDMEAETVDDVKVILPEDTKGKYTLLGLAYSKNRRTN
ncbi:MAG: hypothetical protein HC811_12850 [Flammeovirgaceae bacterium]|nr:hypothetical protein [Flammeovirgaceae bacterium]